MVCFTYFGFGFLLFLILLLTLRILVLMLCPTNGVKSLPIPCGPAHKLPNNCTKSEFHISLGGARYTSRAGGTMEGVRGEFPKVSHLHLSEEGEFLDLLTFFFFFGGGGGEGAS